MRDPGVGNRGERGQEGRRGFPGGGQGTDGGREGEVGVGREGSLHVCLQWNSRKMRWIKYRDMKLGSQHSIAYVAVPTVSMACDELLY